MSEWEKAKNEEIIGGICDHFNPQIVEDPQKALFLIEQELACQNINLGNDWLGRGVVGDTVLNAAITGLEIARGKCLAALKDLNNKISYT
ncbi:hypothetical protein JWG39_10465 [Desulforhopalus vacuolatus]|uniref:hypothetical protein n=1 Tax=Desulforhopalus vacuolatus TaxID=40414 RepID=UPI001965D0EF|nr:hypothetical protein [Desulforhopalus vacuolatus]MBM9520236.1 hypothetical protein [Desulforhopalus vacuolatus]